MYDKLKDDFSPKGRNRVVRIDPPRGYPSSPAAAAAAAAAGVTLSSAGGAAAGGGGGGGWGGASTPRGSAGPAFMVPSGGLLGLDELDVCLRECVRASFEARQAAYMAEVGGDGRGGVTEQRQRKQGLKPVGRRLGEGGQVGAGTAQGQLAMGSTAVGWVLGWDARVPCDRKGGWAWS